MADNSNRKPRNPNRHNKPLIKAIMNKYGVNYTTALRMLLNEQEEKKDSQE